jgi:DNA-binding NarL/FixJ family response regulator
MIMDGTRDPTPIGRGDSVNQTRMLLVDDQRLVAEGLSAILEREPDIQVVGQANSAAEALELCATHRPTLALADVWIQGSSCVAMVRAMRARVPDIRILALTSRGDDETLLAAVAAGADGFIRKSVSGDELIQAVRLVARGQMLFPVTARPLFGGDALPPAAVPSLLTEREMQVLRLVAQGATSRDIAASLFLSTKTVDNHRSRILEKLQARNKADAVALAIRRGLLESDPSSESPKLVISNGGGSGNGGGNGGHGGETPRIRPVPLAPGAARNPDPGPGNSDARRASTGPIAPNVPQSEAV